MRNSAGPLWVDIEIGTKVKQRFIVSLANVWELSKKSIDLYRRGLYFKGNAVHKDTKIGFLLWALRRFQKYILTFVTKCP
jgi:hypothetical protein